MFILPTDACKGKCCTQLLANSWCDVTRSSFWRLIGFNIVLSKSFSFWKKKEKTIAFWTRFYWSAWLSLNIFCCLNWLPKCTTFYQIYLVSSLLLPRSILFDRTSPLFKSFPIKFLSTPSLLTLSWAWMHMMTLCKHELKMRHLSDWVTEVFSFDLRKESNKDTCRPASNEVLILPKAFKGFQLLSWKLSR